MKKCSWLLCSLLKKVSLPQIPVHYIKLIIALKVSDSELLVWGKSLIVWSFPMQRETAGIFLSTVWTQKWLNPYKVRSHTIYWILYYLLPSIASQWWTWESVGQSQQEIELSLCLQVTACIMVFFHLLFNELNWMFTNTKLTRKRSLNTICIYSITVNQMFQTCLSYGAM